MKGHLGFVCRRCVRPGSPTNLRQSGTGTVGTTLTATLAWDAPNYIGDGPVLEYIVEVSDGHGGWPAAATTSSQGVTLSYCTDFPVVRVAARNKCGRSDWSYFSGFTFTSGTSSYLYTTSQTISPPCWATSMKVWCVGAGGTWSTGGAAGGIAWKTWTRLPQDAWGQLAIYIANVSPDGIEPPKARVTYNGTSVTAFAGRLSEVGNWLGGDGGRSGGGGGQSLSSASFSSLLGYSWSGRWYFGGSVAGQGDYYEARAQSPCMRIPLNPAYSSGVLDAVAATGGKTVEDCGEVAAFGSGGVKLPTGGAYYNSPDTFFSAGYGGGGFDAQHPGGPGCVVVKYS